MTICDILDSFQSIKRMMQSDSTDVNYAMSVKEALNFLLSIEYCLIIVCISSLVSNSIAIIRFIRETHPIPIMVLAPRLELSEKIMLSWLESKVCSAVSDIIAEAEWEIDRAISSMRRMEEDVADEIRESSKKTTSSSKKTRNATSGELIRNTYKLKQKQNEAKEKPLRCHIWQRRGFFVLLNFSVEV